ncbi:MAG: hypothetical protein R3B60_03665 [Candidatus Paceibacterota bacterium]
MKNSIEHSTYHSFLRIAVVVFAFLLVFDSGIISEKTRTLSTGTQDYLAQAVGVRVGVAPTQVNQLTARITELEQEVEAKDRLIAVNIGNTEGEQNASATDRSTLILSIILFILLVLIVLNYILDYLRARPILKTEA